MRISDWSSDVCSSDLNRAQVDPHHLLHHGNQDDQARALHLPVAAELEHHAALVFAQHLDCADQQYEQQQDRGVGDHGHGLPPSTSARGSTCSTRPSTARTQTRWTRRTGRSEEHTSELQSLMRITYALFCMNNNSKLRAQTPST